MENILGLDLNELVSKQVSERMEDMESTIQTQKEKISELLHEKRALSERIKAVEDKEYLLNVLKDQFNSLQAIKRDDKKDIWGKTLSEVKLVFFQDILLNLFKIPKEGVIIENGWHITLAIYYYDHKEIVVRLMTLFGVDERYISFVRSYVLPKDWNKEQVLTFVKKPQYNTNGEMFGNSRYWSGGQVNLPYNWIMVNPLMVEEDVFSELIETIKNGRGEWKYLYAITRYANLTTEQIKTLGDTLLGVNSKDYSFSTIQEFISRHLNSFSKELQDKLFLLTTSDNQFNQFHWEKFPVEYQKQFLMNKDIGELLKILTNYSCKWSKEEKENFLKERYK